MIAYVQWHHTCSLCRCAPSPSRTRASRRAAGRPPSDAWAAATPQRARSARCRGSRGTRRQRERYSRQPPTPPRRRRRRSRRHQSHPRPSPRGPPPRAGGGDCPRRRQVKTPVPSASKRSRRSRRGAALRPPAPPALRGAVLRRRGSCPACRRDVDRALETAARAAAPAQTSCKYCMSCHPRRRPSRRACACGCSIRMVFWLQFCLGSARQRRTPAPCLRRFLGCPSARGKT